MKVLITGGAGFIGSHLADRLLARGDASWSSTTTPPGGATTSSHAEPDVVEGTIADAALVEKAFADFGPSWSSTRPRRTRTPRLGRGRPHQRARHGQRRPGLQGGGVRRLIYFQTALCYGLQPLEQPITLAHPIRPTAAATRSARPPASSTCSSAGWTAISFRLANAYGPRNLSGPLPTFYPAADRRQAVLRHGHAPDFIYVDDLVEVVLQAVDGRGARAPTTSRRAPTLHQGAVRRHVKALDIKPDRPVEVPSAGFRGRTSTGRSSLICSALSVASKSSLMDTSEPEETW